LQRTACMLHKLPSACLAQKMVLIPHRLPRATNGAWWEGVVALGGPLLTY
jgi:hypothetical protein